MKRFLDGKMRMLSLLLSLVLAVGLIQANAVTASAAGPFAFSYAYDCQRDPAFPKKDGRFKAYYFQTPLDSSGHHISEPLGTIHAWTLTSLGKYADLSDRASLSSIVTSVAGNYQVNADDIEIFQLTMDGNSVARGVIVAQSPEVTAFFGDNLGGAGAGYLFSNSQLSDPTTVTISNDVSTDLPPQQPAHVHNWPTVTPDGNGSKEASATITCTDPKCGETVTVTLKASDVTLPGDVFTAEISTTPGTSNNALRATPALPEGLRMSSEPGYKYSVSGSDFTSIDPNNFTPKQGIYQASIVVMSGNAEVANLAVKYTVSDPVVTAATGDNRPIEMMVMGLVVFSAMASVAFIFDSKRRVGR